MQFLHACIINPIHKLNNVIFAKNNYIMKSITLKTINNADEYIFHLSTNQLQEELDHFRDKQDSLATLCKTNSSKSRTPDRVNFIDRLQLAIFLCFDEYNVTLPPFTEQEISNCDTWWRNKVVTFPAGMNANEIFSKMGEAIGQKDLTDYIIHKFEKSADGSHLFKGIDCEEILTTSILFAALYSRKIGKLPAPASNK